MKTKLLLSVLILGLTASVSSAASIDFTGLGKAEVVTVAGTRNVRAWAGELNWTWLSGKPVGLDDSFYSYCVDLLHNETDPQTVSIISTDDMSSATAGATLSPFGAQKAAWLFNTYAATVHGASGTGAMAAGLQLAIWEVLYDNGLSLGGGTFWVTQASAAALSAGSSYLDALNAPGAGYTTARATVLDAALGLGQDQIISTPVPEPGTLALLGIGLAGLVMRRRQTRA